MAIFALVCHDFLLALLLGNNSDSRRHEQLGSSHSVGHSAAEGFEPDTSAAVGRLEEAHDCQEVDNLIFVLLHSHCVVLFRFGEEPVDLFALVLSELHRSSILLLLLLLLLLMLFSINLMLYVRCVVALAIAGCTVKLVELFSTASLLHIFKRFFGLVYKIAGLWCATEICVLISPINQLPDIEL